VRFGTAERTSDLELSTHPGDDDLGDESHNSAALGLRSILDGLWVPCLLEHAYTSSSLSLEILTSFGSSICPSSTVSFSISCVEFSELSFSLLRFGLGGECSRTISLVGRDKIGSPWGTP
jgi:hypothetical protein